MNILSIFRGSGGEYEWTRCLGGFGVIVYIIGVQVFEAYQVFWTAKGFDLVAYCSAFPAGLSIALGTVALSAGKKDKDSAVAQTIRNTNALPTGATS